MRTMAAIQSLRPNVTREEAMRRFAGSGLGVIVRRTTMGPLQSVAEFYIPFRTFKVEIVNNGRADTSIFGLDAVTGALDLYHFAQIPNNSQMVRVNTRNFLPATLGDAQARELVVDKVRRAIFTRGFFRMRGLKITASPLPVLCHVPYWVGFHGRELSLRFSILDAVRRRFEGGKVRQLLQSWLHSGNSSPEDETQQAIRNSLGSVG